MFPFGTTIVAMIATANKNRDNLLIVFFIKVVSSFPAFRIIAYSVFLFPLYRDLFEHHNDLILTKILRKSK